MSICICRPSASPRQPGTAAVSTYTPLSDLVYITGEPACRCRTAVPSSPTTITHSTYLLTPSGFQPARCWGMERHSSRRLRVSSRSHYGRCSCTFAGCTRARSETSRGLLMNTGSTVISRSSMKKTTLFHRNDGHQKVVHKPSCIEDSWAYVPDPPCYIT